MKRSLVLLLALALAACAGFAALGVWQVHRLAWKEALIARVDARLQAAPAAAPGRTQWAALTREGDEYRRVSVEGHFDYSREALVRASTKFGTGFWVVTPMRTDRGEWVLVNRGFIPPELRAQVPRSPSRQAIAGLLRFTEPHGSFLQANDPAQGRWYSRDVAAIARTMRLESPVAPYFVDEQPAAGADATAWPRAGLTVVDFPNNHLVYALTWFALAAGVAVAAGYVLATERHLRRSGEPTPHAA
jgi:surfeit locus 1 family protein